MFTWYWLADLCRQEGIEFVLRHALYMKAIHGDTAKNDKVDAFKIATLLRGGNLPKAYVYPPEMRSTRDLLRRRLYLVRGRAKQHDPQAYHRLRSVPGIGKILALTILYEIHDIGRFERVQDFLSYARLVKCDHSSAGKKLGTGGAVDFGREARARRLPDTAQGPRLRHGAFPRARTVKERRWAIQPHNWSQ